MNLRKILRIAVVTEWFLLIAYLTTSKMLIVYLPIQLQDYKTWTHELEAANVSKVLMMVSVPFVVCHIISTIGLFFIKPWAKWLYTAICVIGPVFVIFKEPTVEHAISSAIGGLSITASGVILSLIFFTNVIPRKKG